MVQDRIDRRHFGRLACGIVGAVALAPSMAMAQNTNQDATAIIRSLAPKKKQEIRPNTSIPATPEQRPVTAAGEKGPVNVVIDTTASWDATIYFDYDSAVITTQAKKQLAALGLALVSPELASHSYLVAGHTDAIGSAEYNRDLSQRRAASVRRYLIEAFDINPTRLLVVGFGFDRLKTPNKPTSPVNRRVEVALIVGGTPTN